MMPNSSSGYVSSVTMMLNFISLENVQMYWLSSRTIKHRHNMGDFDHNNSNNDDDYSNKN